MAIDPFGLSDTVPKGLYSSAVPKCKDGETYVFHSFRPEDNLSSSTIATKCGSKFKKPKEQKSPYVYGGDKLQLLSRVTERKTMRKKDYNATFPTNVYKANSDEFKGNKKANKKVRKSVLTLPNEQAPMPQSCTVSDVNEEYIKSQDEERKTRRVQNSTKKPRFRNKDYIFYDRDAKHCSQMSIDLDCSSTDMIKHFGGDTKSPAKRSFGKNSQPNGELNAHDVWAVLRNINRFQFKPSPPDSNASIAQSKKKQITKRRNNRKERRVIETCRTEELTYIAKFEVDSRKSRQTISGSSSLDRVTVINTTGHTHNAQKGGGYPEQRSNRRNNIHRHAIEAKRMTKTPYPNNINYRNYKLSKDIENKVNFKLDNLKSRERNNSFIGSNHSSDNRDSIDSSNHRGWSRPNRDIKPYSPRYKELRNRLSNLKERSLASDQTKITASNDMKFDRDCKVALTQDTQHKYGMTRMIISHEAEKSVPKIDTIRKPRLVTTMPSAAMMPKMTAADIKKRICQIRFPLVILAKDELSSTIEVLEYDPPQFDGLTKKVWPFMLDWNKPAKDLQNNTRDRFNRIRLWSEDRNVKKTVDIVPKVRSKCPTDIVVARKRVDFKCTVQNTEPSLPTPTQQPKKPKPIRQFKDKMLKLLYKKSNSKVPSPPEQLIVQKCLETKETNTYIKKNDASTETYTKREIPKQLETSRKIISPPTHPKSFHPKNFAVQRHPWSKVKWASDFIDNVIKKIKSGTYYNDEPDKMLSYGVGCKDTSVQNDFIGCEDVEETIVQYPPEAELSVIEPSKLIPGFAEDLPVFEIKSLNLNQIAVKHRLTNVIIQFDVTVPLPTKLAVPETITAELCSAPVESMTCIPLKMTESHTTVFKSKTTIINAILPAEICSVLPKIMKRLMDLKTNSNMNIALPPICSKQLRNITEISEIPQWKQMCPLPNFLPLNLPSSIKQFFSGRFSGIKQKTPKAVPNFKKIPCWNSSEHTVVLVGHLTFECQLNPMEIIMTSFSSSAPSTIEDNPKSTCTALVPYIPPSYRFVQTFETFNFNNIIDQLMNFYNSNININLMSVMCDKNTTLICVPNACDQFINKSWTTCINKLSVGSIFEGLEKTSVKENLKHSPLLEIEHENMPIKKIHQKCQLNNGNKSKRKGFVNLYKKCKSTSNIAGEKNSTSLAKISNLDDFFQALGSGRLLTSVFDGCGEKNILSSLKEMKSWITDITPRQALLVLLLTNKKKTPNLVRYQPVLLQGIAVNRITRASELDMEIEVIERENINKIPQFNGITYALSHTDSQDNLFEELSWIAKTTASDYQKPYDESSEKLLKSLLAKRKRLNPSYLRVMARYVGLGLLKQSKNN